MVRARWTRSNNAGCTHALVAGTEVHHRLGSFSEYRSTACVSNGFQ